MDARGRSPIEGSARVSRAAPHLIRSTIEPRSRDAELPAAGGPGENAKSLAGPNGKSGQAHGLLMLSRNEINAQWSETFFKSAVKSIATNIGARYFEIVELVPGSDSVVRRASFPEPAITEDPELATYLRHHAKLLLESGAVSPAQPPSVRLKDKDFKVVAQRIQLQATPVGVLALVTGKEQAPKDEIILASAAKAFSRWMCEFQRRRRMEETHALVGSSLRLINQNYLELLNLRNKELDQKNQALQNEIRERWRAENALRLLVDVTAAASEARDLTGMLNACLDQICGLLDWPVGQAWILDTASNELVCAPDAWCSRTDVSEFRQASLNTRLSPGLGLPGRVWQSLKPCFVRNIPEDETLPLAKAALAAGLKGHFGFPIVAGSHFHAVLEFLSPHDSPPEERFLEAVDRLGRHLGIVFERLRGEAELRRQRAFIDRVVSSSQEGIFAFDNEYRVTLWNPALERLFAINAAEALGRSAFDVLPFLRQTGDEKFLHAALEGKSRAAKDRVFYRAEGAPEGYFDSYYAPIWRDGGASQGRQVIGGLAIIHDVTEYKRSQDAVRELSPRLLKLQEEERRRIARELHDGPAQTVAAVSMYLTKVKQHAAGLSATAVTALDHSAELTQQAVREIRSISYLLYPPELGSLGFASGLQLYIEGFMKRTGIQVKLEIPPRADQLPEDVILALFRVAQQCLSNVHRHSGGHSAKIELAFEDSRLSFEVADDGRGFPAEALEAAGHGSSAAGVGIAGMRDRVRQLRGELRILSDARGSRVIATLPLPNGRP